MELNTEETHYLSPISLGDDSDNALSPVTELEPNPGIDGTPVRCTFIFAWSFQAMLKNHLYSVIGYDVCIIFFLSQNTSLSVTSSGRQDRTIYSDHAISRKKGYERRVRFFLLGLSALHFTVGSSIRFFYKPLTLSALTCALILLAYVAMTQDVLEEGRDKRRV